MLLTLKTFYDGLIYVVLVNICLDKNIILMMNKRNPKINNNTKSGKNTMKANCAQLIFIFHVLVVFMIKCK